MTNNEIISRAKAIAAGALASEVRSDGSPFMGHVENVAGIVENEIGLGGDSIAAVFLHEATRNHPEISLDEFPQAVRDIVDGLNNISRIRPKDTRLEAENYKKLIVNYSKDPRVTVIKICDRLEVMRNLSIFPKTSRDQKILETLMLYIPLAHQLGLYNIKREMEDIYLKYAEPEQFRAITNKLKATEKDREKLSLEFIEPLKRKLSEAGIQYKLKVRTKSAYSIYAKMQKQKVGFDGVFDVFAIRFIIDCPPDRQTELDQCWKVYSYVTEEYLPDLSRLRDWLTNPKPNGYESLHITVRNSEGKSLEVQIRTRRMDEQAESGSASHWSYKGIKQEKTTENWLQSVRYTLEHPFEVAPEDVPAPPSGEIFVFTPTGELKILPTGATILDFAFSIHSGLGCKCVGGKINGKAVSFKEKLSTGDVVEILSSKNQKPSADWLGFVTTGKAKTKIKQELDADERKLAAEGREIVERRLKNWKLEFPDSLVREFTATTKSNSIITLFAQIGSGAIDVNEVKEFILRKAKEKEKEQQPAAGEAPSTPHQFQVKPGGDNILVLSAKDVKGMDYRMSKCCNPVFGDEVFGFVTRTEGIKIHRISCPNAARLLERYPYRIQKVAWQQSSEASNFQCTLAVTTENDGAILARIMEVISQFKVSIRSCNVSDNQRMGTSEISIRLLVPSNTELDKVLSQVSNIRHVIKVKRV